MGNEKSENHNLWFKIGMSSFLENMRLNEDLKEKLYSASDKVLNYVNERPLWERLRSLDEFYFRRLKI